MTERLTQACLNTLRRSPHQPSLGTSPRYSSLLRTSSQIPFWWLWRESDPLRSVHQTDALPVSYKSRIGGGQRSRTSCLRVMSPVWNRFTLPRLLDALRPTITDLTPGLLPRKIRNGRAWSFVRESSPALVFTRDPCRLQHLRSIGSRSGSRTHTPINGIPFLRRSCMPIPPCET